MPDAQDGIRESFAKLGLSEDIAAIYVALYTYGQQTIAALARSSKVERTRIYRLMDELVASGIIEVEIQYKRHIFSAAPIDNLTALLLKKEQELQEARSGIKQLQVALSQEPRHTSPTKVQSYRGPEGLKQMLWNQTRSNTECVSILYEDVQTMAKLPFFERWVHTYNERQVKSRSIVGDHFVGSLKKWYGTHANERLQNWQSRYVSEELFSIHHSTVIYNNVTAYYNWKKGEVFGIEIHNDEITKAQRQFFEILWSQATPRDIFEEMRVT